MTKYWTGRNEETMRRFENKGSVSVGIVMVLADMAENDVYPNGTFSDAEVSIWEAFSRMKEIDKEQN